MKIVRYTLKNMLLKLDRAIQYKWLLPEWVRCVRHFEGSNQPFLYSSDIDWSRHKATIIVHVDVKRVQRPKAKQVTVV